MISNYTDELMMGQMMHNNLVIRSNKLPTASMLYEKGKSDFIWYQIHNCIHNFMHKTIKNDAQERKNLPKTLALASHITKKKRKKPALDKTIDARDG